MLGKPSVVRGDVNIQPPLVPATEAAWFAAKLFTMKSTPTFLTEEPPLAVTVEACHAVMREWWVLMQEMRARLLVLEEPSQAQFAHFI